MGRCPGGGGASRGYGGLLRAGRYLWRGSLPRHRGRAARAGPLVRGAGRGDLRSGPRIGPGDPLRSHRSAAGLEAPRQPSGAPGGVCHRLANTRARPDRSPDSPEPLPAAGRRPRRSEPPPRANGRDDRAPHAGARGRGRERSVALELRDCTFFGPALPEPFVKFELEAASPQARAPAADDAATRAASFASFWEAYRRKLRDLGEHGGDRPRREPRPRTAGRPARATGRLERQEERRHTRGRRGRGLAPPGRRRRPVCSARGPSTPAPIWTPRPVAGRPIASAPAGSRSACCWPRASGSGS